MIVTNNLWQFDNKNYREMCSNIGIKAAFSSSFHPQANVQVKVANKIFKYNLKTWLYKHKRAWVDELPDILWAYQTTLRIGTRETSFSLAFGADANNPVEIGGPNFRTEHFQPEDNGEHMRLNLDLVQEKNDLAQIHIATYLRQSARYYNSRVK